MRLAKHNQRLLVAATSLMLVTIGSALWYGLGLGPADPTDSTVIEFKVAEGEGAAEIAANLDGYRLIRSRSVFLTYATLNNLRGKFKVGTYRLNRSQTAGEIARVIAGGKVTTKQVIVPEGATLAQIRDAAAKQGISPSAFDAALKRRDYSGPAAAARPAGASLEGYLFPETYTVTPDTTAAALIQLMLDTFQARVGPYQQQFAARGMTLHQGLTFASMVEKEAGRDQDRPIIAQVFHKRLQMGMRLESDPTVQYALGLAPGDTQATAAAIRDLNSPYNTYKVKGLPPGPIASPGIQSIEAVLRPAPTDYLFFVGRDNITYFARNLPEHEANIRKYLQ